MLYELYIEFVKDNWKLYSVMIVLLLGLPLQKIAIPHYYGKIIETIKDGKLSLTKKIFLIMIGLYVLTGIFGLVSNYINKLIWPKMEGFIRQKIFNLILERYNEAFEDLKTGEIQTKLHDFPWFIDMIYNKFQSFVFTNTIILITSFIYLSKYHINLGVAYIISIISIFLLSVAFVYTCKNNVSEEINMYNELFEELDDILNNIISVFSNKKLDDEIKNIEKINKKTQEKQINTNTYNLYFQGAYNVLNLIIFIVLNYISYDLYVKKKITLSALSAIVIINFNILDDMSIFYNTTKEIVYMKGRIDTFNKFINDLPELDTSNKKSLFGLQNSLEIKFKNIMFKPRNSDKPIYEKFNLHIPVNQDIIIMGHIGSGKSTFAKLLVGLHKYNKGDIFLNNMNFKNISINEVRENILYVPQHPKLFNRSLWENIIYGLTTKELNDISTKKIYETLDKLGMHDIKKIFENRMFKLVGKNGSYLSGGQRQLVWLLRCIFKKCPVIIFDEPTSSLDGESKKNVIKLIELIKREKTVMIISHDPDFKSIMDRLIVFEKGNIKNDVLLNNN